MAVLDEWLHSSDKRSVLGAIGCVLGQTEQLFDTDLDRVSVANAVFEFSKVAADEVSFGVVFVDQTPAITDEPTIDAVGVGLAFVEHDVWPHPFCLGESPGCVIFEDGHVWLVNVVAVVMVAVVVAHEPGKYVALSGVGLLEIEGLLVVFGGQIQAQPATAADGSGQFREVSLRDGQVGVLLEGQYPCLLDWLVHYAEVLALQMLDYR